MIVLKKTRGGLLYWNATILKLATILFIGILLVCSVHFFNLSSSYSSRTTSDGPLRSSIDEFCESLGYPLVMPLEENLFSERHRKETLCVFWDVGDVYEASFIADILLKEYPSTIYHITDTSVESILHSNRSLTHICKHSLLVTNSDESKILNILKTLQESGFDNRGVFLLSDEGCSKHCRDISRPYCDYIIRNYWCEAMNSHQDAYWMPLGYAIPFVEPNENTILPCFLRKYTASFKGSLKSDRLRFIEYLKNSSVYNESRFLVQTTEDFHKGDPAYKFRGLLMDSQIIPCPAGVNSEQFRIWVALSTASIPILQQGETFFKLPQDHPLIIVESVEEMVREIERLNNEPLKMMKIQCKIFRWWLSYKRTLQRQVPQLVLDGRHLNWQ
ncbi:uncharacterized protein Gasu_16570 [Galdieria sulphuraria]|uniref:RXYLT1 C-terminal domain-containing protein n=1 Tax=Galdieria sulphuraria TaxID=130081 RepID=M2Y5N7_GALSU|nr:uncharacterized protein Gasu_16570 [Galdieria sulphuraria]EME31164.1 hypothetical protein Gasu_16570 [Galdieria sulphuraria]|eukprot:XP_005707684.1 hypothetical protein Gasu_16570 [Galdieria sulphuraria]